MGFSFILTIVLRSCILMLFKQNAKLCDDFELFYIPKGFWRPWRNIYKGFSRYLARGFSSPWINISMGHFTFSSVHCSNLDFKIFIPYFFHDSKMCFSLFDIYLTSSILPPFLIPNTYTEESKTTKCCWYRGTYQYYRSIFIPR